MKLWREIEAAKVKVGEGLGVTSSRAVAQIDFMLRQAQHEECNHREYRTFQKAAIQTLDFRL